MGKDQMTKGDAARIQSGQAKNGGDMSSQGFAARAQSAAARNEAAQSTTSQYNTGSGDGAQSGGSTDAAGGKK
ncbi:hypothetical protein F4805DRAFT_460962 [Annulohypoxylon moriforme]|nr:hypothetical protein F4805DRAFT_460962 [Annulohypoxylon moriforme]